MLVFGAMFPVLCYLTPPNMPSLCAYIINLDRAPERWSHMEQAFGTTKIPFCRVAAVDGQKLTLPSTDFEERRFRLFHGRKTNIYEVACFYSHIKAMKLFLESDYEHAMICEDDIFFEKGLDEVLDEAFQYSSCWNVLRLTGLQPGKALRVKRLPNNGFLCLQMGRLKGCGATIIDRIAARAFVNGLLPMWLPWDHAIDREWVFGLKCLSLEPFPISQIDEKFQSSIQQDSQPRLARIQRWMTTYPYQALNELSRWIFRFSYFLYLKSFFRLKARARTI